jgi:hypothetical protein
MIASIASNTPVGDGYDIAAYDIEIEAVFVSHFCPFPIILRLFYIFLSSISYLTMHTQ